ncbi:hypothetical protein EVAR_39886_1 [Eumeta japonica]|uniref:Uncharacterized protein n=1 Tax=Eumeta variegata TaxID=151549 RepID=A0A4C1WQQ2_EUMVA|nr:hypothetical protein EVAR_39886_1 [Eumeta japonica]
MVASSGYINSSLRTYEYRSVSRKLHRIVLYGLSREPIAVTLEPILQTRPPVCRAGRQMAKHFSSPTFYYIDAREDALVEWRRVSPRDTDARERFVILKNCISHREERAWTVPNYRVREIRLRESPL